MAELTLTMVRALNLALDQAMDRDDRIVLLGQDIGINGGVFRVTDGLWKKYGGNRVIDTPLSESAMAGSGVGLALAGLRPVVEMQFSGFALLAIAHLEGQAARFRSRTQGRMTVPMVVRMPYGGSVRAPEHHSDSQEAMFAHIPGLTVVIPSTPRNAHALLSASLRSSDPVIFMEPIRAYRSSKEELSESETPAQLGKAEIVCTGSDLTVICWGAMRQPVVAAVDKMRTLHNVGIEVIDLLTVSPMDTESILTSVSKTKRCLVVQEAARSFSVSSEIVTRINEGALRHLSCPVMRVTGYDVVVPCAGRESLYYPSISRIRRAIEKLLDLKPDATSFDAQEQADMLIKECIY